MRILALILGVVALIGSCFTGLSYFRAWRGERAATIDTAKASFNLDLANGSADVDLKDLENRVDSDNNAIDTDKAFSIAICHMKRACIDVLIKDLVRDQKARDDDTQKLEDEENFRSSGGVDRPVAEAMDHLAACEQSRQNLLSVLTRDQHFAYVLLGLWVAFGFAFALSRRT